ncbi:b162 [miniopterid betaherpesvirus 1]|uniref:B162 n=1 Tax=miniopterid betaherpesvirus 1 TaxID=3070189 RepID=I3VQG4_9BETA|nr:b162 [miniopterid betaherpesvirus 1]AFK84008.1 b162 [miniopterid betaherpesvirus 1]
MSVEAAERWAPRLHRWVIGYSLLLSASSAVLCIGLILLSVGYSDRCPDGHPPKPFEPVPHGPGPCEWPWLSTEFLCVWVSSTPATAYRAFLTCQSMNSDLCPLVLNTEERFLRSGLWSDFWVDRHRATPEDPWTSFGPFSQRLRKIGILWDHPTLRYGHGQLFVGENGTLRTCPEPCAERRAFACCRHRYHEGHRLWGLPAYGKQCTSQRKRW